MYKLYALQMRSLELFYLRHYVPPASRPSIGCKCKLKLFLLHDNLKADLGCIRKYVNCGRRHLISSCDARIKKLTEYVGYIFFLVNKCALQRSW